MYNVTITINKQKIISYLEIFLFFILTVGPLDPKYKIVVYIILIICNYKYWYSFKYISRFHVILFLSMIIPMILDISNVDSSTSYSKAGFAYLLPFIFCILYQKKYSGKVTLNKIEHVSFFISLISLLGYFIVVYFPNIIEHFPSIVFYGRNVKTILLYGAIRDYSGGFLLRNCGIAFEPGAFQFVSNLGLALFLMDLKEEQKSKFNIFFKSIIYILAVFTTKSTTGLVITACILAEYMTKNKKSIFLFLVILVLFSGTIASTLDYQHEKMKSGNIDSRFGNTVYVIEKYGKNVMGVGSTGYDKLYSQDKKIGSWDTYSNLYLRFGLIFLILFLIMNLKLFRIDIKIFIVIFLTLLTESLIGPIIILLYYMALKVKGDKKYESFMGV